MKTNRLKFKIGQQVTLKGVPKELRHGTIIEVKNSMGLFSPRLLGYMPFWLRMEVK